jgi:ABC-type antimicrobial peptide transport system permease subunit
MRLIDRLKLSLHSIVHNKGRTLITVIIVFVVSLLIMVISILGLSFYQSVDNAFMNMFDKTGTEFQLDSYYNSPDSETWENRGISMEEYTYTMSQFEGKPELIDNVVLDGNIEVYYLFDETEEPDDDTLFTSGNFWSVYGDTRMNTQMISVWGDLDYESKSVSYIKSGRLWTKEDEGDNKVWVSESFITKAMEYGKYLSEGEDVVLAVINYVFDESLGYSTPEVNFIEAEICGVFSDEGLDKLGYSQEVYIDALTLYGALGDDISLNRVRIINEVKIGYDFNTEYKKMKEIVDNVNEQVVPSVDRNKTRDRFECGIVSDLKNVKLIGGVLIGACVFIGFIILIISIGSVANTIIISVDKNKKFLGVMMAVGLKRGGVKSIVQYEALIMIILATGLAYGVLYFVKDYFTPIIDFLMLTTGLTDDAIIAMPFYIPVITISAFIIMALLFAKNSLKKIAHMDVISVISEVS